MQTCYYIVNIYLAQSTNIRRSLRWSKLHLQQNSRPITTAKNKVPKPSRRYRSRQRRRPQGLTGMPKTVPTSQVELFNSKREVHIRGRSETW